MHLNLGVCMLLKDFKIMRIDNVNLDSTVCELKNNVAEKINFLEENIELTFCGITLQDSKTLKEVGLEEGFVVNVLQKKEKEIVTPFATVPESEVQDLVRVFQILATRNAYRRVLQKLNKPDVLENIISTTPGLSEDDVAIVILQHPELIAKLGDVNAARKVIEQHPTLANAARNLVAAVQNDVFISPSTSTSLSNNLSQNIPFVGGSDDEEMESLASSDSQNRSSETTEDVEQPLNVITQSQVAAALANTTAIVNRSSTAGTSGITREMMSAAVQQAIASTSTQNSSTSGADDNIINVTKIEELRKLGFSDDAKNIEALQLANGDLEMAVNILLTGLNEDS